MTWNYRIVRYKDGTGFGLHEVHYDAAGKPWSMTTDIIGFSCDSDEGSETIIKALEVALHDAKTRGVFDEPEEGKWPGEAPDDGPDFSEVESRR